MNYSREALIAFSGIGLSLFGNAIVGAAEDSIFWRLVGGVIVTFTYVACFAVTVVIFRLIARQTHTIFAALGFTLLNTAIFAFAWFAFLVVDGGISLLQADLIHYVSTGWDFSWITIISFAITRFIPLIGSSTNATSAISRQ